MSALRTPAQNTKIWSLIAEWRKHSGLEQSELKGHLEDICEKTSGQRHSSKLTPDQARRTIELLQQRVNAARPSSAPAPAPVAPAEKAPASRRDMITRAQQGTISGLFALAQMGSREQQMGFCRRQCGLPWPQTKEHADKVIEALKAICMRTVTPEDIEKRAKALDGRLAWDAWKANFVADLVKQFGQASDKASVLTPHKLAKLMECEAALAAQE